MKSTSHFLRCATYDRTLTAQARIRVVRLAFRLPDTADVEPVLRVLKQAARAHATNTADGRRHAQQLLAELEAGGPQWAEQHTRQEN